VKEYAWSYTDRHVATAIEMAMEEGSETGSSCLVAPNEKLAARRRTPASHALP
jgi:hypothetical protein